MPARWAITNPKGTTDDPICQSRARVARGRDRRPAAAAHNGGGLPDAEIFATNNTALITDEDDPRLRTRLRHFARTVTRIIGDGGGRPRGSELLDGVFFSSDGGTTFETSRRFDVDRVSDDELHDIAETVRRRFLQQSVLTFDHLHPSDPDADAIELDVPRVTARALRNGLLDDPVAQERLFGGSVTEDRHLLLVAGRADADLARAFAKRIGGDVKRAVTRYGEREFVEVATAGRARIEKRTLVLTGTGEDDKIALRHRPQARDRLRRRRCHRLRARRRRFDRIRVDGGDGSDTLRSRAPRTARRSMCRPAATASACRATAASRSSSTTSSSSISPRWPAPTALTVDDLSQTDMFQVDSDLGAADGSVDRVIVNADRRRDEQEQNSISAFSGNVAILVPTFVQLDERGAGGPAAR